MGPRLFSRGNSEADWLDIPAGIYASMGPRLFSRGNKAAQPEEEETEEASMGPRLFSRGNKRYAAPLPSLPSMASMGPRLFSRGNPQARLLLLLPEVASMGPRLFSRGNTGSQGCGRLQSERFNGAAAFQPRKPDDVRGNDERLRSLQWGRGFSAAETNRSKPLTRRSTSASMGPRLFSRGNAIGAWGCTTQQRGFNGAAAFQPRKRENA